MQECDMDNLRLSIDEAAEEVAEIYGSAYVADIFAMYGAHGSDDLREEYYQAAFSDLQLAVSD